MKTWDVYTLTNTKVWREVAATAEEAMAYVAKLWNVQPDGAFLVTEG